MMGDNVITMLSANSVTAIADKMGLDFALIHKKRDRRSEDAPERMELLVGVVKDKALQFVSRLCFRSKFLARSQFL
jgi:hypothetical protein